MYDEKELADEWGRLCRSLLGDIPRETTDFR